MMQPNHFNTSTNSSVQQQQPWGGPYPALHMWPLHETFSMKMIYLPDSQRIKIGRQTNAKTVPSERNAYFDSKVLSRLHAEVWEQGGKIFIRDSKSSNGTFINTERLSPEGVESEPFELKSEDIVEFGIDIVSDDSRTIIHHKVASKVYCVFNADDAASSARELVHYQSHNRRLAPPAPPGPSIPIAMSSGGKANGLSFEHVMMKLQAELAKSRETGAELSELTGSMGDIQDTLGGGLPPSQNGSASQLIPMQFRSTSAEAKAALAGPHGQQAAAFIALQNQLSETQSSLNAHIDRIRGLESSLTQSETVRSEVAILREQMEESKREMDMLVAGGRGRTFDRRRTEEDDEDDDDDDTRSVMTVMDNQEEERPAKRGKRELINGNNGDSHSNAGDGEESTKNLEEMTNRNQELASRVQTLSEELSEATRLSQHLQSQHDEAMSAIGSLATRIGSLESGLAGRIAEAVGASERKWETWRVQVEDGWKSERESWEAERERLRGVVRDWEEASRRANEEDEDRTLNERLSGEDNSNDEGQGASGSTMKQALSGGSMGPGRRLKRRRQSNKTNLALKALRDVSTPEGQATPTQTPLQSLSTQNTRDIPKSTKDGDEESALSGSDKSSLGSSKDSVDTLRDKDAFIKGGQTGGQIGDERARNQVPFFTVLVVAVFAGALYYRHKE